MAAPVTSAKTSSVVEVAFNPTASIDFASGFTAGEGATIAVIQRKTSGSAPTPDFPTVSGAGGLWDTAQLAEHITATSRYNFCVFQDHAIVSGTATVTYGSGADIAAVFCFLYLDADNMVLEAPVFEAHLNTSATSGSAPATHNIYMEPQGGTYDVLPMCLMEAEDGSTVTDFTDDGAGSYGTLVTAQLSDPLDGSITYRFGGNIYYDNATDFSVNIDPAVTGSWPSAGRSVFWSYEGGLHQTFPFIPGTGSWGLS